MTTKKLVAPVHPYAAGRMGAGYDLCVFNHNGFCVKDIDLLPSSLGFGRCHHLGAKLAGRLTCHPKYGVYTGWHDQERDGLKGHANPQAPHPGVN